MQIIRIGDKVIDSMRIHRAVDQIFELRSSGLSQQEVADRLGVDRTLVSRLESLGEIRKGPQVALIGFPVSNGEELSKVARAEGVDFIFLMNEEERLNYVHDKDGADLINQFMDLTSKVRDHDVIIFIGSDKRIKMIESLLGNRVISWEIGISPMKEDRWVNPDQLKELIRQLKSAES